MFSGKKKFLYFFLVIGIGVLYYYAIQQMKEPYTAGPPPWVRQNNPVFNNQTGLSGRQIGSFLIFILVWVFSTALYIAGRWIKAENRAVVAESDRKTAELSFLKAQINPHFLFNTLNNIYTLSLSKSEKTSDAIMRLSKIMRYVTGDVQKEKVPLEQELNCVRDFIDLQKLRLSPETVRLNFTIEGNTENKLIAPLILLPFVENVFKYGISNDKESVIKIVVVVNDKQLDFFTENTVFKPGNDAESTGVGIENVKRRLNHIYKDKYSLDIGNSGKLFTVKLSVPV
ncbi:MAG: sensor histidine kinase [Chitinophagaceae bacterium]|nr:sensor histidine kinase [Chitinophagaceae bacterium]